MALLRSLEARVSAHERNEPPLLRTYIARDGRPSRARAAAARATDGGGRAASLPSSAGSSTRGTGSSTARHSARECRGSRSACVASVSRGAVRRPVPSRPRTGGPVHGVVTARGRPVVHFRVGTARRGPGLGGHE